MTKQPFAVKEGRKGQMEMIGLVVIVVLVITAMLFYLIYRLNTPTDNLKRAYMNKEIATNMIIALGNTNIDECFYHETLSELIKDCASMDQHILCNLRSSCSVAESVAADILNSTFSSLSKSYTFTVTPAQNYNAEGKIIIEGGCAHALVKDQGVQNLPVDAAGQRTARVTLDVCDG